MANFWSYKIRPNCIIIILFNLSSFSLICSSHKSNRWTVCDIRIGWTKNYLYWIEAFSLERLLHRIVNWFRFFIISSELWWDESVLKSPILTSCQSWNWISKLKFDWFTAQISCSNSVTAYKKGALEKGYFSNKLILSFFFAALNFHNVTITLNMV